MDNWYEATPLVKLGAKVLCALVAGVCFNHLVYWANDSYEDYLDNQVRLQEVSCEVQNHVN